MSKKIVKQDYNSKTKEELTKDLQSLKVSYQKIVENLILRKEKNTRKPRQIRKEIARVQTSLASKN